MNWRDITSGGVVYHSLFTHWGPGTVEKVVSVDLLESMFERGNRRVLVKFDCHETAVRLRNTEIRKTPNKRKIREMVAVYQSRGVDARDGGDRLILPGKSD